MALWVKSFCLQINILSLCSFVRLSICSAICLSSHSSVCSSVHLSVSPSIWLPLVIMGRYNIQIFIYKLTFRLTHPQTPPPSLSKTLQQKFLKFMNLKKKDWPNPLHPPTPENLLQKRMMLEASSELVGSTLRTYSEHVGIIFGACLGMLGAHSEPV